jgi:diguanylate cyclase (GGDEF)-like protein
MIGAAPLVHGQVTDSAAALRAALPAEVLARRLGQRRQTQLLQAASYALVSLVMLAYCYAGTISIYVPCGFLLAGAALTGLFVLLSEAGVNDRFADHYLTVFQIVGNVLVQVGFMLAVPQIGIVFLGQVFLVFGFGALRMTPRQAIVAWTVTTAAITPVMLFAAPIGLPMTTPAERAAAILGFILTLGQCTYVGLFGNALRKQFYRRSVELKDAYRRIEELAELDELTGAYNRRCILGMLDDEIARTQRDGSPCSVALIDLDWFKRINDAFGHPTGDEVLRAFAITVFANIRSIDRFGRYGGEEFLLVLPDTPDAEAARILERLRGIVAELDWSAFSTGMRVTISAGVAMLAAQESADGILARADAALYAAKGHGRNRVAIA